MDKKEDLFFEKLFYNYLDQIKFLFFPDKWSSISLDYSKNELLSIVFIYRKESVNMSEVAEYINAPLNTVTGVINRLEKKQIVERKRDSKDKRVVNIALTSKGKKLYEEEKNEIIYYVKEIYKSLTEEEKKSLMIIAGKIISVLKSDKIKGNGKRRKGKRVRKITIE
ncbi:MarR family transcriptional regulator [Clostridium botulinum]|nr:MarR family transcriptional regulator [Clostridium botulinum]